MCNDAEPEDFERSAYYNEWVRPQGFRHAVGSILEDSAVRLVHIGFLRNERRRPFAYDDARSLDRVLPHIHRAIRSGERLRTAISASGTVFALVDSLRLPALLVDESKRVLHANYATETFIRSSAELSLSGGRIAATDHRANKTLQAALDAACSIDSMVRLAVRTEVIVPKDAGLPIVVELLPLRSEYRAGFGEPRCLVIANDPDLALPKKLLLLREAYGLTPVEARLAWVLANGESLADYAEHSAIAVSTARWHLKNIQAKTGARTLEAVIGLVHASILRF
jgi:DNA-binding CsgD family transcriptional regulator